MYRSPYVANVHDVSMAATRLHSRRGSMLPTMYPTGLLVATLFAAVIADVGNLPPHNTTDQGSSGNPPTQSTALVPLSGPNNDQPLKMSEFCFFGKFPSATCRFRCHLMTMEAFCVGSDSDVRQSGEGKCECVEPKPEPEPTPEEGTQDMFAKPETHKEQEAEKTKKPEEGQKTPAESTPTFTIPMHTALQEPEEDQNKQHVVFYVFDLNKIFGPQGNATKAEGTQTEGPEGQAAPAGWAFQHFVAILIIALLLVLIALELFACYKKQRATNNDMESVFKNIPMPNKV